MPETIKDKRLLTLDLSGMVAGSKYRGEFEERIKKVIAEVKNAGNVLLFLDEIHTIIGAGGAEGAIDASNILKPFLQEEKSSLLVLQLLRSIENILRRMLLLREDSSLLRLKTYGRRGNSDIKRP